MPPLDSIDHIAIPVEDVASAVDWYKSTFHCEVTYQDATWAFLKFGNIQLALVIPSQHPAHIAFTNPHAEKSVSAADTSALPASTSAKCFSSSSAISRRR